MKKIILNTIMTLAMVFGFGGVTLLASDAVWADGVGTVEKYVGDINDNQETDLMGKVKVVINVVLGIIGVISVAVIILGGVTYSTSQGDTTKVKKAKDTILYGVIGLVVALLAFAVVNFVLTNIFGK